MSSRRQDQLDRPSPESLTSNTDGDYGFGSAIRCRGSQNWAPGTDISSEGDHLVQRIDEMLSSQGSLEDDLQDDGQMNYDDILHASHQSHEHYNHHQHNTSSLHHLHNHHYHHHQRSQRQRAERLMEIRGTLADDKYVGGNIIGVNGGSGRNSTLRRFGMRQRDATSTIADLYQDDAADSETSRAGDKLSMRADDEGGAQAGKERVSANGPLSLYSRSIGGYARQRAGCTDSTNSVYSVLPYAKGTTYNNSGSTNNNNSYTANAVEENVECENCYNSLSSSTFRAQYKPKSSHQSIETTAQLIEHQLANKPWRSTGYLAELDRLTAAQHQQQQQQQDGSYNDHSNSNQRSNNELMQYLFLKDLQVPSDLRIAKRFAIESQSKGQKQHNSGRQKMLNLSKQNLCPPGSVSSKHRSKGLLSSSSATFDRRKSLARSRVNGKQSQVAMTMKAIRTKAAKPSLSRCTKLTKLILILAQLAFVVAGICVGVWGILSQVEDYKYHLSTLYVFSDESPKSLLQLLSVSFIIMACLIFLFGILGLLATHNNNKCMSSLFILLVLVVFALNLAIGLMAIILQERLAASIRSKLVNKFQDQYGIESPFTSAIDYVQTKYECCGIEGPFDYERSVWRLHRLGGLDTVVARTCCRLQNSLDEMAYINPRPANETMCQSNDTRFQQNFRFRKGCNESIEQLLRQKIWHYVICCSVISSIILLILILAISFCSALRKRHEYREKVASQNQQQQIQANHRPSSSVRSTLM